jgi:hypothetical protein
MKNINKSIENSEVVSILKTRTLFVLMIEQTLVKFEKEHSDLMCGYDEYGTVLELRDRKKQDTGQSVNFYARRCHFTTRSSCVSFS